MQDMVPKGTGNSRFLKSVENFKTLYPTYDSFAAAMVAGNLPVDFNGVNPDGVEQVGTALNANNLLKAATEVKLWNDSHNRTVDEAFARIADKFYAMASGGRLVRVYLTAPNGSPASGFTLSGIHGPQGETIVTDANGYAEGVVDSDPATISTVAFADVASVSMEVSAPAADMTEVRWTIPESALINFVRYDSSTKIKLSSLCTRLDVTVVGGGGGGAYESSAGGGGGGGGDCTVKENVAFTPGVENTLVVGSGGIGSRTVYDDDYGQHRSTSPSAGGASTAFGLSAGGGSPASGYNGGAGNGKGGTYDGAKNGVAGSVAGYLSFTETVLYGGGGGAGGFYWLETIDENNYDEDTINPGIGGAAYGGAGGAIDYEYGNNGGDGKGPGGGGGGATAVDIDGTGYMLDGGDGAAGCVAMRMWH